MALPNSEIKAIAKLLKTQDEGMYKLLEEQIMTFDVSLLREINNEISLDDIETRRQFLDLAKRVKRVKLKVDFLDWSKDLSNDLEKGVFLLAQFDNPLLDLDHYVKVLNSWAISLSNNLKKIKVKGDPTSVINELNHFLFMELGFSGNKEDYYAPDNSFIDKVLEKRIGNPISLSMVCLLITKRIGLPISAVNMPAHFLIQYMDSFEPIYIDPFNQGEIITRSICQERIKTLKLSWQEEYLSSPTNKQIICRMLQNLVNIYHNEGDIELKECLEGYLKVLKS
jgi:regulator of sirC expression with transglutaminase-like and TPR domain